MWTLQVPCQPDSPPSGEWWPLLALWGTTPCLASPQEVKIDKNLEPGLRVTVRLSQQQLPGIGKPPQPGQPEGSDPPPTSVSLSPSSQPLCSPQKARPTVEKSCRLRTLAPKLGSTGATRSGWPPASVRTELPFRASFLCEAGHREPCLTQKSEQRPCPWAAALVSLSALPGRC